MEPQHIFSELLLAYSLRGEDLEPELIGNKKIEILENKNKRKMAIILARMMYLDNQLVEVRFPVFKNRIDKVLNIVSGQEHLFCELCQQTIMKHRINDDLLRYFYFLLKMAKNNKKLALKVDRRKVSSDLDTVISLSEAASRIIDLGKNDGYKISKMDVLREAISCRSLKDIKKSADDFLNKKLLPVVELIEVYNDYSQRYGATNIYERDELLSIGHELKWATEANPKSEILIDVFLYLTDILLHNTYQSKDEIIGALRDLNSYLCLNKSLGEKNLINIKTNALSEIDSNESLKKLYEKIQSVP